MQFEVHYLANDYRPPKPLVGEKQAADPAEPVVEEFAVDLPSAGKC